MSNLNKLAPRFVFAFSTTLLLAVTVTACAPDKPNAGADVATPSVSESVQAQPKDKSQDPGSAQQFDASNCLVGSWTADNEHFLFLLGEFGDEVVSVDGEVVVTLNPDGSMQTEYRDWLITSIVEGNTVTINRSGTDLGQYRQGDGTVSIQDTQVGSLIVVSGGGLDMEIDPDPVDYASASFSCDASTATISTVDSDMKMIRR